MLKPRHVTARENYFQMQQRRPRLLRLLQWIVCAALMLLGAAFTVWIAEKIL